ncbi:HD domain-containing phosphohydrolase [Pseudomonas benzenivorans]|uniref:Hpt domain-containing protein n=1 Tax=Pseudomonas benzenivorans TaxID=556533 RepID=A0ABY5H8H6_9PSED|nr:HD domain-containing phosphohydrolase [Pseudomonas benzenivorans]UTW08625.1 Hpt domain-containing protein [Pseudomonas benzenivorans]
MATPRIAELSSDQLDDFRQEASEQFQRCEQLLIELEHAPEDEEHLRDLFRQVHTLKGNLGIVGLSALFPLPQALEDVLDRLRQRQLDFDSLLGDILLLSLDHLKELLEQAYGGPAARLSDEQIDALGQALRALAAAPQERQAHVRRALLEQLDPSTSLLAPTASSDLPAAELAKRHGLALDADLLFFLELMQASERRSHYWQGRGMRILDLALTINRLGENPEDPAQLAAAVCLHDLGMAFLPLDILHKNARLSDAERTQMRSHPDVAYDMLRRMPDWTIAAEIALQHHEHADGSGYPKGLKEAEIRPGALILNIVDTFDARTHERAHQTLSKRPLLRAILEINGLAGSQFSAAWVEAFNRTLHQEPELGHR